MAKAVQLFQTADFTGGLNLRDDAYQIRENESPDCLNVRLLPQGGFERRKSVTRVNATAMSAAAKNVWPYIGNGVSQIVVQLGSDAAYSTGGDFTAINPDALTTTGIMRATQMERASVADSAVLYVQRNAEQVPWKWNGSSATVLADAHGAYNEDIEAPNGGNMPLAKYIIPHLGFMFCAYTKEGSDTFPNRIRFSHPGEPEDWRADDFFPVGLDDSDSITGLATVGEVLFVFKERSVWTVTGFDADTWQWSRLVAGVGAVSQEAISVNRRGVAWFDRREGVFLAQADGKTSPLWLKLRQAIDRHDIPQAYVDLTTLSWLGDRLFVSTAWEGSTINARTFVFDPEVGKEGAWYAYGYGVGPMIDWRPSGIERKFVAVSQSANYAIELDAGTGQDNFGGGAADFDSYFTTGWFAVGAPALKKRWRRPSFVVDNDLDTTIIVNVYTDFTRLNSKRQFLINTTAADSDGLVWGVGVWGDKWGAAPEGEQSISRGSGLGRAYVVAMKFTGPTDQHWSVNALDLRYIPQKVR